MNILTSLIVYQGASVAMCVGIGTMNVYVEGTLTITVAGKEHTLTVLRLSADDVLRALETKYLHHDWTTAPVVEVRGGRVVSDNVTIVDFDNLKNGGCPQCSSDLEFPWDIEDRECQSCHFTWTKEDE